MTKFIIKRLLYSIVILFFVMLIVYLLMYSLPSSYVETKAREMAMKPGSMKSAAEWLKELNAQYGMDKGVIEGYFTWLKSAVKGDFGESWQWTVPVTQKFKDVIWYSFALGLVSFILEIVIAIPLGVVAARKQYSLTAYQGSLRYAVPTMDFSRVKIGGTGGIGPAFDDYFSDKPEQVVKPMTLMMQRLERESDDIGMYEAQTEATRINLKANSMNARKLELLERVISDVLRPIYERSSALMMEAA